MADGATADAPRENRRAIPVTCALHLAAPVSTDPDPPRGEPAPRWSVSSRDWQSHAIDVDTEHPDGVYVARCGHELVRDTSLHDEPPGWMCLPCLRWTERGDTSEVTKSPPEREEGPVEMGRPRRWARSRLDCHPARAASAATGSSLRTPTPGARETSNTRLAAG